MTHEAHVLFAMRCLEKKDLKKFHSTEEISEELGEYWIRQRCTAQSSKHYTSQTLSRLLKKGYIVQIPCHRGFTPTLWGLA